MDGGNTEQNASLILNTKFTRWLMMVSEAVSGQFSCTRIQLKVAEKGTRQSEKEQRKGADCRKDFCGDHMLAPHKTEFSQILFKLVSYQSPANKKRQTNRGESQPHAAGTHLADPGGIAG